MNKLLSTLFLLLTVNAWAQGPLDSLQGVIDSETGVEKAKALIGMGMQLGYTPDRSYPMFMEAVAIARAQDDKVVLSDAFSKLGMFSYYTGQFDNSLAYYDSSLAIHVELHDSAGMAKIYNNLGVIYDNLAMPDKALENYNNVLEIQKQLNDHESIAIAYGNIGLVHQTRVDYEEARRYHQMAIDLSDSLGLKQQLAKSLQNMGGVYWEQGFLPKASEYYFKCLKIADEIADDETMANAWMNLGFISLHEKETEQAMDRFRKAMNIHKKIQFVPGLNRSYGNIANLFFQQEQLDSALYYYDLSKALSDQTGNIYGTAMALRGIGNIAVKQAEYAKATEAFSKAMQISQMIGDKKGEASINVNMGKMELLKGAASAAIQYCQAGLSTGELIGALDVQQAACKCLSDGYQRTGKHQLSLEHYKRYITLRDSISNEENTKEITQREMNYEFDKEQMADSLAQLEADRIKEIQHQQKIQQQRYYTYGGGGAAGLLLIVAGLLLRGYRQKQKSNVALAEKNEQIEQQKQEVEHQKEIVEEKNKEITDSITYAKRIQEAILPPDRLVKEYLANSFVLYKPKDLVAGDFYWLEAVDGRCLFAAADCTGHGVPGAMVSVVCHNALNRSVREFGLTNPGKILDKTRELVIETFEKSDHEVKDGMDIALCTLKGTTLHYAGANNPIWLYRKGIDDIEQLEEVKADKQPIGKYADATPFTTHTIQLNEGDTFYIFSDGFPDQFGGPKGKKFKYKPFKLLLLEQLNKPLQEQRTTIDNEFENWRGELEQVDDVCVIGVRV